MNFKRWWNRLHHIYKIVFVVACICVFSIFMLLIINAAGHGASKDERIKAANEKEEKTEKIEEISGTEEVTSEKETTVDVLLASSTDSELIKKVNSRSSELEWIKNNSNMFPEGTYERASNNPEFIAFLYEYGTTNNPGTPDTSIQEDDYDPYNDIRLYQWDKRWGYKPYGDPNNKTDIIGIKGSAPTALSMAIIDLSTDTSVTPDGIAKFIVSEKGYNQFLGTDLTMIESVALNYGLTCETLDISDKAFKEALGAGKDIILRLGDGNTTDGGHFVIITSVNEENEENFYTIHDPYSQANSMKQWKFKEFSQSITGSWTLSKNTGNSESSSEE